MWNDKRGGCLQQQLADHMQPHLAAPALGKHCACGPCVRVDGLDGGGATALALELDLQADREGHKHAHRMHHHKNALWAGSLLMKQVCASLQPDFTCDASTEARHHNCAPGVVPLDRDVRRILRASAARVQVHGRC